MQNGRKWLLLSFKFIIPELILCGMAWWLLGGLRDKEGLGGGNALSVFIGVACIALAGVVASLPIARFIANPLSNFFFPGARFSKPLPLYSVPETKRTSGLYEEAISGYEEIAADYPEEMRPYLEMMDIAIVELHDTERAEEIYQQARSIFTKPEDREILEKKYAWILECLDEKAAD